MRRIDDIMIGWANVRNFSCGLLITKGKDDKGEFYIATIGFIFFEIIMLSYDKD